MLETKEQKQILAGCLVLVIILSMISFWGDNDFRYTDQNDYARLKQASDQRQKAYTEYLASLGTTPEAQKQMFEEIFPLEQIQTEIKNELQTNQVVVIPEKPRTQIKVANTEGREALENYFNSTASIVVDLDQATDRATARLFTDSAEVSDADALISSLQKALNQYAALPVPKEAADLQNHYLVAVESNLDLARVARNYAADPKVSPWPEVYKSSAVIAQSSLEARDEFNQLDKKYSFSGESQVAGGWLIKPAQAFFGGLVVDVFQRAESIAKKIAVKVITNYATNFVQKMAKKAQESYTISNFLYYSDALVSGLYADDYLNKYVDSDVDRQMIKQFIPAVSCGQNQDLGPIFTAKANQHLGFDPNSLDPADKDYFIKMARVGNFLSSPYGWQAYYKDAATAAQAKSQTAAQNELNAPGTKASRDQAGTIGFAAQYASDFISSAMDKMIGSGFNNAGDDPWASQLAVGIADTFLNAFVFKGVVLKEQKACIGAPIINFVTPVPSSPIPNTPEAENPGDPEGPTPD